jgi:hypothetical protein
MRYFGLLLWAGAGYGVGALAATLWRPRSEGSGRGGAAASASEGQSMGAFWVVAAVMLYLLVAEVWFGH